MDDQKRGDDAADHAPRQNDGESQKLSRKQDAPNYDERADDGQAIKREDVSSANDE